MIIEWTCGAYYQGQRYFGLCHWQNHLTAYSVAAVLGEPREAFTLTARQRDFEVVQRARDFKITPRIRTFQIKEE